MSEGIAYLIKDLNPEQNNFGQWSNKSQEKKEIFVTEKSITRSEWAAAGKHGFNPEMLLTTPKINYSGEDKIEYKNKIYGIYRSFENEDEIELYLRLKAGV